VKAATTAPLLAVPPPQQQSLAERFLVSYEETRKLAEQLASDEALYLKSCRDGRDMPIQQLMLLVTGNSDCRCEVGRKVVETRRLRA
jgi:hypothetical protein